MERLFSIFSYKIYNHINFCTYLILYGANVNIMTKNNETPLHIAKHRNHLTLAEMFEDVIKFF